MASLSYFCGNENSSSSFLIWDSKSKHFGSCFQWLCLTGTSHFVFAIVAAFLLGIASRKSLRSYNRSKTGIFRLILCYIQAAVAIISVILAYTLRHFHPPAFVLSRTLTFTTWLICALLCHKLSLKTRMVRRLLKILLVPFIIILSSSSIQLYDYIKVLENTDNAVKSPEWYVPVYFGLNVTFFLTMLAGVFSSQSGYSILGRQLPSLVSTAIQSDDHAKQRYPEEDALLGTHIDSYDSYTFGEPTFVRDSVLGWAEEEANIVSKIFFHWVNPLMKKGNKILLKKADDLFFPPLTLDTKMIKEIFQSIIRLQKLSSHFSYNAMPNRESNIQRKATVEEGDEGKRRPLKISLTKALYRAFGVVFMAVGLLKFLTDCLSFAGPVLLNYLVSFMENKKVCIHIVFTLKEFLWHYFHQSFKLYICYSFNTTLS